jgi:hypothetical protein
VNARTLLASAALLATVLVVPLLLEAQRPAEVSPRVRSVTVRNDCPNTVWIFYGGHPPLHTRDMFAMGPDMQSSEPVLPGDMIWLLDENARELDRAVFEPGVTAITVLPTCAQLQATHAFPDG